MNIPEADDYVVWCRIYSANDGTDSFYVTVDNEPEDVYDTAENAWANRWQWTQVNGRAGGQPQAVNPRVFSLSQGIHYLVFRGREQGTVMDALYITNDRDFTHHQCWKYSAHLKRARQSQPERRCGTSDRKFGPIPPERAMRVRPLRSALSRATQKLLIPTPAVSYISPDTTGALTLTPAPQATGVATITVTVNDGQAQSNIVTRSFTVTVSAVNDQPTLDPINDLVFNEDPGMQTISLSGITSGSLSRKPNFVGDGRFKQ